MRYTKRIYHDRQPRVGDTIVAIRRGAEYNVGHELTVISTKSSLGNAVRAYSDRIGYATFVSDGNYRIFTDITYVKTGEQHIVKRFLGIPFYRKTIDIYEEELTYD